MKFYNTLTHSLDYFKPIKDGKVNLYTCGPTVYDRVHIGNFRTYIFEDLMRRTFKAEGLDVSHVMNITDVDDKTIRRSREQYPGDNPKEALQKLTAHYERAFLKDSNDLGIDFSDSQIVRATDHITQMQDLIKQIPSKYVRDDGVYFDIAKYPDYGVLVKLDRSHEHHRINNDEYDKEHVADFALWKAAEANEPSWDFEIDGHNLAGRPGWHIECSAMATKYLGQPFDIHSGGVDLIFPHHENEIAQSRSANQKPLANYFIHCEHLLVEGKKMSKSSNNFYTLEDIQSKGYDPLSLRLLILQSHYRSQLSFTWDSLTAAQAFLKRLQAWADLKFQSAADKKNHAEPQYESTIKKMKQALANDLNSSAALSELAKLVTLADEQGITLSKHEDALEEIDQLFGLQLSDRADIDGQLKQLLSQRETARLSQNWAKSDELRQKLSDQGIEINDTPDGPIWYRQ